MIRIYQDFIPKDRHNRPGYSIVPQYITIHDTGNPKPGAGVRAHAAYLKGDVAAKAEVSWHFTVDDKMAVQHLPLNEMGWHAGDSSKGPGNSTSVAIEICENSDGNRAQAEENAAQLAALLLRVFALDVEHIVPHKRWIAKDCPHILLPHWDAFMAQVCEIDRARFTPIWVNPQTIFPKAVWETAKAWAQARGATDIFIGLADMYWTLAPIYRVRPDVAYCQSAKETAFGRFPGVVTPGHHNWCGLKIGVGGGNSDPNAHMRFPDDRTGVVAHLQHLSRYAGIQLSETILDPRYELVPPGRAVVIEDLGGKWAPGTDYGVSIVRDYLDTLSAFTPPSVDEAKVLKARIAELEAALAAREADIRRIKEFVASV